MMEIILAGVVSLVITLAAGKLLIPALIRLKAGQSIKEVGPTWHKGKQGTPTMGGLMFIIGIGLTIVVLGWQRMMAGSFVHLYVYLFALVFGAIGYIDFTENMDTCIAIRIAYKKNGKVFVRSGAGIVADSVPEKEYEECLNKAKASLKALRLAQEDEI